MTRFAGLPERQNTAPKLGARFSNLPEQLASMSRPENVDRIRAAAKGEAFTGRLGTTKTNKPAAATPQPSAPAATAPKKPPAQTPQPPAIAIPADVAARGPKAVAAYEVGYARAMVRGAELAKHPAAVGRSAEVLSMVRAGKSDTEIVAHLTEGQRAKAADAVWDRARASINGSPAASVTASKPALEAKSRSADDVWTRAYAAVAR